MTLPELVNLTTRMAALLSHEAIPAPLCYKCKALVAEWQAALCPEPGPVVLEETDGVIAGTVGEP